MIHIKNIETDEHRIVATREEIATIRKEFGDGPKGANQILARLQLILEKIPPKDAALVKYALMHNWEWQEEGDVFNIDIPWVQVFAPVDDIDLKMRTSIEPSDLKADPLYRWPTSFDPRT